EQLQCAKYFCAILLLLFFFSSRRRHTMSVSAFLLNRSSDLSHLSFCVLLQYLGYDATPFNQILKQNAKREMRLRLGKVTVADVLAAQPVTTNLLKDRKSDVKGETVHIVATVMTTHEMNMTRVK